VNSIAVLGTAKGVFFIEDEEQRGPYFADERFLAVAMRPDGLVLAASVSEHWGPTWRRSDDFGETWAEHDERVIAFPHGLEWTDHWSQQTQKAALLQVWQIHLPEAGGTIYAGVEPAALFRSEDDGRSFELVRGLWDHPDRPQWYPGGGGLALHTILVDPSDESRLHVAVSTGGVYRSDDGGKSWRSRNHGITGVVGLDPDSEFGQCVHKVVRDAADPDMLYLQNHGGVFRSADRGDTWVSIAEGLPSDFGFPMVAHPNRAHTAYTIPLDEVRGRVVPEGRCRVYRTTDGGDSWEAHGAGLPQQNAYLNVLRDAFCGDGGDPFGLWFGTRSGHVFRSADEGESWRMAGEFLPAVFCIRAVVPA
jgi:photosystem II stability/assembly factor-like uncharacterized protein